MGRITSHGLFKPNLSLTFSFLLLPLRPYPHFGLGKLPHTLCCFGTSKADTPRIELINVTLTAIKLLWLNVFFTSWRIIKH